MPKGPVVVISKLNSIPHPQDIEPFIRIGQIGIRYVSEKNRDSVTRADRHTDFYRNSEQYPRPERFLLVVIGFEITVVNGQAEACVKKDAGFGHKLPYKPAVQGAGVTLIVDRHTEVGQDAAPPEYKSGLLEDDLGIHVETALGPRPAPQAVHIVIQ